jgi:hypothetical protein
MTEVFWSKKIGQAELTQAQHGAALYDSITLSFLLSAIRSSSFLSYASQY